MEDYIFDNPQADDAAEEYLMHYGTAHQGYTPHSGRYKWGSGENAYQRHGGFLRKVDELKKQGLSETEIAAFFNMNTSELRAKKAMDRAAEAQARYAAVYRIYDSGITSPTAIGKKLGMSEGTIRGILRKRGATQHDAISETKEVLREAVAKDKYIDVGLGVAGYLGVSQDRLGKVAKTLKNEEGYTLEKMDIPQANTGNFTSALVLAAPGTTRREILQHLTDIKLPFKYSEDGGLTYREKEPIQNIDSKRIYIRWNDEGGSDRDGTIELRPGVEDLSLGGNNYAQVRIGVDDKYYLKGMAVYRNDIPEGYDIVFNTNKKKGTPLIKVFKPQDGVNDEGERVKAPGDPSNPFGSALKGDEKLESVQRHYIGADGKEHLSPINFVKEEGDVGKWQKGLPSQFLAKQSPKLAKRQLDLDEDVRMAEFNEIMSLTNPVIKAKLLQSFSDSCDTAAVELKAAALPRQRSKVILPITSMKDDEIYAPDYNDGEEVVLIRYPHGGIFEIPRLRVNNNVKEGKEVIGNGKDAVGINMNVASMLSGADFDGDTVVVIPTKGYDIKTLSKRELSKDPFKSLREFDPKQYKITDWVDGDKKYQGHKVYKNKQGFPTLAPNQSCGMEMGIASNLIMDMTTKGATWDELVRATKYSMVTIDAFKHGLNFYQAYDDLGIHALKEKYQRQPGGRFGGASTLMTRVGSPLYVPKRLSYYKIDPETGQKVWGLATGNKAVTHKPKTDKKTGEVTWVEEGKTTKSTKGAEMDPYDLMSEGGGYEIERVYADYARRMKALGDKARYESVHVDKMSYSEEAAKTYAREVQSLKDQLAVAERNSPIERQAQLLAKKTVDMRKYDNPALKDDSDAIKKITAQAIVDARASLGAKKQQIMVTEKEWEAIQAGAVRKTTLESIIKNADERRLKELAMPREKETFSESVQAKIIQMDRQGYSTSEIANRLGLDAEKVSALL